MKKLLLAVALVAVTVAAQAVPVTVAWVATTATGGVTIENLVAYNIGQDDPAATLQVMDIQLTFSGATLATEQLYIGDDENGDPMYQTIAKVREGSLWNQQAGEDKLQFLASTANSISFTLSRLGTLGSTGSGTIARIYFVGTPTFTDVVSLYAAESTIFTNAQTPTPNAVPEPMTLVLVASALAGLGVVARKRS